MRWRRHIGNAVLVGLAVPCVFVLYVFARNAVIPHENEGKGGYYNSSGQRVESPPTAWWCENWWYGHRGWSCTLREFVEDRVIDNLVFRYHVLPIAAGAAVLVLIDAVVGDVLRRRGSVTREKT